MRQNSAPGRARRRAVLACVVALGCSVAACGGTNSGGSATVATIDITATGASTTVATGSDPTPPLTSMGTAVGAPATNPPVAVSTPPATSPVRGTDLAAAMVDPCATIPTLERIGDVMGVAITSAERLERGPGTAMCEASDGEVTIVDFTITTDADPALIADTLGELGYEPTDAGNPALPGAYAYAGAVELVIGTTSYTVQTIALDTLGDPNAPAAIERSGSLLADWLALLGVQP